MKKQYIEPEIKSKNLLTELPFNLSVAVDGKDMKVDEETDPPSTGDSRTVSVWGEEE